jgi:broad specificity phosphatase PhoE
VPDFLLIRHGESVFNTRNILNGDPSVDNPLSDLGREQCASLSRTIAAMHWASAWTTRFPRTSESLALIAPSLAPGAQPVELLDDLCVGEFEGRHIEEFRQWRRANDPGTAPVGGESLVQAVERYAHGLKFLLEHAPRPALVILHDQPIRYVMNAQAGDDPFTGALRKVPNAVPYPFSEAALQLAADRLDRRGDHAN